MSAHRVCGCCEPAASLTPLAVENRPALSALAYRIGTYASFRESMLHGISRSPDIRALTTRDDDDYAITVLDLWSAVADVLTFYQERYANEAFLRTATQQASVMRLARLLDYHLRPGVAATAWLAFTLDSGTTLTLTPAMRVQSVPGANESPQTYETLEEVAADARLNRLRVYPAPSAVQAFAVGATNVLLDRTRGPATAASLAPGQKILLFRDGTAFEVEHKELAAIRREDDRVVLDWVTPVARTTWKSTTHAYRAGRALRLFGYNAPATYMEPFVRDPVNYPSNIVWNMRTLGASDFRYPSGSASTTTTLAFDGTIDGLAPGQRLLIATAGGSKRLVTIDSVTQAAQTLGSLSATVTQVTLTAATPAITDRRRTIVYELIGDEIAVAAHAYASSIAGTTVYLPGAYVNDADGEGVAVGRTIEANALTSGTVLRPAMFDVGRSVLLTDDAGHATYAQVLATPTLTARDANGFCHLVVELDVPDGLSLDTASAVLLGNVVYASHGETVRNEVVGSGNAATSFQTFSLKKQPLTYVPSDDEGGTTSSLVLSVGGVRWSEADTLYGEGATARVFSARLGEDGAERLQFGDGVTGARVPTLANGVVATYRVGSGLAGRVRANTLTTALDRPKGLSAVTNPLAAGGGADAQTLDEMRENAPRSVITFGRAVSLQDFESLVTDTGEVVKASAIWLYDGLERVIHVTVAAAGGDTMSDDTLRRLGTSLGAQRDPNHRLRLANFVRVPIRVRARVHVNAAYSLESVQEAARAALEDALSFDTLRLGQPIHSSDVYHVLQDIEGVDYVDLLALMFKLPPYADVTLTAPALPPRALEMLASGAPSPVQPHLRIFTARPHPTLPGRVLPAEIAWIDASDTDLVVDAEGGVGS